MKFIKSVSKINAEIYYFFNDFLRFTLFFWENNFMDYKKYEINVNVLDLMGII